MCLAELVHTGGDQMTAAQGRGSQRVRSNSERGKGRLEGLQPVVEDWHAKVCLLGVCYHLWPHVTVLCGKFMAFIRWFGSDYTIVPLLWMLAHCTNSGTLSTGEMLLRIQPRMYLLVFFSMLLRHTSCQHVWRCLINYDVVIRWHTMCYTFPWQIRIIGFSAKKENSVKCGAKGNRFTCGLVFWKCWAK